MLVINDQFDKVNYIITGFLPENIISVSYDQYLQPPNHWK